MFDNENNEQEKNQEMGLGRDSDNANVSGSSYGSSNSTGSSYGSNSTSGYGNNTGNSYGSSYGNSTPGSYGNTSGSSYGTGAGNSSYGQNRQNNPYGQNGNYGNYTASNGTGTGNGYQQGTNGYGNYNYNNQNSYGNYQYNYQQPGMNGGNGPRKKGTGKKVAAVIAVALVLFLGLGAGYYSMTKIAQIPAAIESKDSADASGNKDSVKEKSDQDSIKSEDKASDSTEAEISSKEADEIIAESNADSGIAQTETGGETTAVVTDVTEVVAEAMPAMVSINNNFTQSYNYFGQTYSQEQTASGSGIIVGTNDSELLIATNYHVIEGADSLEVQFVDENKAKAEVKGTASDKDLAVIAVQLSDLSAETKSAIAIATLGDSDSLTLGEPAIAIGNALGYGQSVTTGVISAVNRVIDLSDAEGGNTDVKQGTFIQTSAAINPGNSGGALLNINGEVIGINSNKIGGEAIEGMGYAIPISTAKPIIMQLMTEKTRAKVAEENRGYLGISGVSVTSDVSKMYGLPLGVYVAAVTEDGGAKAAGVQENDIITKFDGKEISSMDDLQNKLAYYEAGETITITVQRQGDGGYQEHEIEVTLGSKQTIQSDSEDTGDQKYDGQTQPDAKQEEGQEGYEQQGDQQNGFDPFSNPFGFGFNFGN